VAAALVIGLSFGGGWMAHGTRAQSRLQRTLAGDPAGAQPLKLGEGAEASEPVAPDEMIDDWHTGLQARQSQAIRTVATIRFGPEDSPAEVPVLAGPGITADWLAQQPPPVSEHEQVVLARQGYQVEQRRRFLTAVLADGRRVAIPVDHVQIQYTGNEPF
jgi:hypothetical protein